MRDPIVKTSDDHQPSQPSATKRVSVVDHALALKLPLWKLAAASQLHGWPEHFHHAGQPFACSEDVFRAAIDAATGNDPGKPHAPAVSEHRGKAI